MKFIVEFFRVREGDNAHAIVGREVFFASDIEGAVTVARQMHVNLDMPQRPDGMALSDGSGRGLYSETLARSAEAE